VPRVDNADRQIRDAIKRFDVVRDHRSADAVEDFLVDTKVRIVRVDVP